MYMDRQISNMLVVVERVFSTFLPYYSLRKNKQR